MQESDGLGSHLKRLVERLLQQDIPDQCGIAGNLRYNLTSIKIVKVKLPSASLRTEALVLQNVELFICGNYDFLYQSFFTHTCSGQFDIHVGNLSVILGESHRQRRHQNQNAPPSSRHHSSSSSAPNSQNPLEPDHHTILGFVRFGDIKCMISKTKCKFTGGSARMCQMLARFFTRLWRTDIEESIAEYIKSLFQDEEEMTVIAIMGLFALNAEEERTVTRGDAYPRRLRNYLRHR